jgi:hypothetical protein
MAWHLLQCNELDGMLTLALLCLLAMISWKCTAVCLTHDVCDLQLAVFSMVQRLRADCQLQATAIIIIIIIIIMLLPNQAIASTPGNCNVAVGFVATAMCAHRTLEVVLGVQGFQGFRACLTKA